MEKPREPSLFRELSSLVTEGFLPESSEIDSMETSDVLRVINEQDRRVAPAVAECVPEIARAVDAVTASFRRGGRLLYVGAGTSGRLGILDAAECPPTFGTDPEEVVGLIAGGKESVFRAREGAEDVSEDGARVIREHSVTANDSVVGLAASRRTPWVHGALREARRLGAFTALVTCNRGQDDEHVADVVVAPVVGPEVVAGSTRMKAGTAQKLVLNMISTASMVRRGKTLGNLMPAHRDEGHGCRLRRRGGAPARGRGPRQDRDRDGGPRDRRRRRRSAPRASRRVRAEGARGMNLAPIDWTILVLYVAVMLGVGIALSGRASRNVGEFFLTGRSLPWWIAGTSMVATTFAADTPLVVTSYVRSSGIGSNWIWFNFAISHLLTTFFLSALWRRARISTDVEFIAVRYSGRGAVALRAFKGTFYAFVTNSVVMGWVILAMSTIIVEVFMLPERISFLGIEWSSKALAIGGGLSIAVLYASLSGLWGVVVTDLIQFTTAMVGSIVLAISAVRAHGGLAEVAPRLREVLAGNGRPAAEMAPLRLGGFDLGDPAFAAVFWGFAVAVLVQWWSWKYSDGGGVLVQRMSACRTERDSILATLWFTFANYVVRPWPWFLVALLSLLAFPTLEDHKAAYPMMMREYLGPGWLGLMLAAMLAAFMSTIDTHMNLASSYFVVDLWTPARGGKIGDREGVLVARVSGVFFLALGGAIAMFNESIRGLFELLLQLVAGAGAVFLIRWFWWRINAWSELSALIASLVVATLLKQSNLHGWVPHEFSSPEIFVLNVGLSACIWITVAFLTPPDDPEHLRDFVRRVRPNGLWGKYREAGVETAPVGNRLGLWAVSVVALYGSLFGLGKLLLGDWGAGILLTAVGLTATIFVVRGAGRLEERA
jgi:N-acetylmuramic acid 6-phosphate etherase